MAQRWKQAGSLASGGLSLNMFTQDEMDSIHRATLEILETTGVLIGSPEARELLVKAGASVYDEDLVRIPQWLVAEAVASAPEVLTLPGRTPDRDVMLDGRRVVFTNFGEAVYIVDPNTGDLRNSTKKDVEDLTRLVDALDVIPVCERMAGAQDYPEAVAELHNYEALLMNTTKHVFTGGGNGKLTQYMIDMAKAAVGEEDFAERCPVTFNTCPISPLKLTADVCEVIMVAARNGAIVNVLSMGMAGGSTPVNLAGALGGAQLRGAGRARAVAGHAQGSQIHLRQLLHGYGSALRRGRGGARRNLPCSTPVSPAWPATTSCPPGQRVARGTASAVMPRAAMKRR